MLDVYLRNGRKKAGKGRLTPPTSPFMVSENPEGLTLTGMEK
jgi:hypothetical protein